MHCESNRSLFETLPNSRLLTFGHLVKALNMKGYLFDQFGDLSFYDIPALGISMIAAVVLVFIMGFSMRKEDRSASLSQAMVLAASLALLATLGRNSLPLAVLCAGLMLFAFPLLRKGERRQDLFTFTAMVIGLACGMNAVVIAAIAMPILFLLNLRLRK